MFKKLWPFIIFILILFILIITTYKDYGVAWDEKVYILTGKHYLIQIFSLFHIPHNLHENGFIHGGVHIRTHGVFFDIVVLLTSMLFKNFNFENIHLIKAFYSIFIFILVGLIVNKLLGKWQVLFAMILLLLFPRFYGDMFYNSIDVPTTLFFSLSIAYFFYFINSNQNIVKQIFFGLVMALIINQRTLFWYLIPLNYFILFIVNRFKRKEKIINIVLKYIFLTFFTIIFMHLTHPYLFTHPITGIFNMIDESRKGFPFDAAVLFDGQFYQAGVKPLPWYYLPKSMLITIPVLTLMLFFIGNIRILVTTLRRPFQSRYNNQSTINNYQLLYLLCTFYFPFLLVLILKPTLYDSWRQFLFLTIPIVIIATFGLDWIPNIKHWKFIGNWKLVIWIFILTNLIFTVLQMIRLHPYQYIYYNSLIGGLKGAYGKYETDLWGLGYKEAVLWFNKNINDPKKQYKILVEGDPLSSSYYFKPNMQLTTNVNDANYIIAFTRWNFHLQHPGKTIYKVEREGIPLIFIKKLP